MSFNDISYEISFITKDDLENIENIGKLSLPIYYKYSDLLFLLYDSSYILYKVSEINSNRDVNSLVGFLIAKKYGKRHHIMTIAILSNYRRKGLGKLLIDKLKKNDNDEISLYVLTINNIAINFYKKMGFKCIEKIENYYTNLKTKSAYYYVFKKLNI